MSTDGGASREGARIWDAARFWCRSLMCGHGITSIARVANRPLQRAARATSQEEQDVVGFATMFLAHITSPFTLSLGHQHISDGEHCLPLAPACASLLRL